MANNKYFIDNEHRPQIIINDDQTMETYNGNEIDLIYDKIYNDFLIKVPQIGEFVPLLEGAKIEFFKDGAIYNIFPDLTADINRICICKAELYFSKNQIGGCMDLLLLKFYLTHDESV